MSLTIFFDSIESMNMDTELCYDVPPIMDAALRFISERLSTMMWNKHQVHYDSPFGNTGNSFKCETFEVQAYSWGEDDAQPFNFKWQNLQISWYKYLGRGMSANMEISPQLASACLIECLAAIEKMDTDDID